jgi:hypothetical protein
MNHLVRSASLLVVGALVVTLPVGAAPTSHAAVVAPGTRIAFQARDASGNQNDIYTVDPDGSSLVNLTSGPENGNTPSWSPDGTKLAYQTELDGGTNTRNVWTMNVDGSSKTRVATSTRINTNPVWMSDGRILYSGHRDVTNDRGIFTINPDGSNETLIRAFVSVISLSVCGSGGDAVVAFLSVSNPLGTNPEFDRELFSMNMTGGNLVQLTQNSRHEGPGNWSPDCSRIAYSAFDGTSPTDDLHVMNANGTGVVRLTNTAGSDEYAPGWSPDASHLAFSRITSGVFDLRTIAVDGSGDAPLTTGSKIAAAPSWGTPAIPAGSQFTPMTPTRLLDTRDGTGAPAVKPVAGATVAVKVTGGVVPVDASAVVLNVVGTESTADGFLTVFPSGEPRPLAANQNLVAGMTRGNLVTVKVGAGGMVSIFTQSGTHLVADVFGFYAPTANASGRFTALVPARLLDTRTTAKVAAGDEVDIQATGRGGVPTSGVSSVVVNITATEATAAGYITGYASGTTRPATANLNVERAGQTIGNLAILPVSPSGSITLFSQSGTHLTVDVAGYFGQADPASPTAGLFVATSPTRLLDTRSLPRTKLAAGDTIDLGITGFAGVPSAGVGAAVVNIAAVEVTAPGFVTTFPAGGIRPLASSLYGDTAGQIIPSLAYATVGVAGQVSIYANAGSHLVVDLAGYYTV